MLVHEFPDGYILHIYSTVQEADRAAKEMGVGGVEYDIQQGNKIAVLYGPNGKPHAIGAVIMKLNDVVGSKATPVKDKYMKYFDQLGL